MTTVRNDDGSSTTTWDDGTTKTDYPDGSSMTMWPDGRVLNQYPDGTQTLNDAQGNPIPQGASGQAANPHAGDPHGGGGQQGGGQPAGTEGGGEGGGPELPNQPNSTREDVMMFLDGTHAITDLTHAVSLFAGEGGEAVIEVIEPIGGVVVVVLMALQIYSAITSVEHGCEARGWCYGVMYGALDRGTPAEPTFKGYWDESQEEINRQSWHQGVASGAQAAQDLKIRNRILLRVAYDHQNADTTLTALWHAVAEKHELEQQAHAYPSLSMDSPVGT